MATNNGGSPPRAWGQLPYARRALPVLRFTPTGVGTMRLWSLPSSRCAVHPHGRGDNDA